MDKIDKSTSVKITEAATETFALTESNPAGEVSFQAFSRTAVGGTSASEKVRLAAGAGR